MFLHKISSLVSPFIFSSFCLCLHLCPPLMAQSLSTRIDDLVSTPIPSIVGTPASDGLQLRRLSLDLRLTVPTASETEAFLADTRPDRWEQWVKRFMADPLHRERLVDWLDKTLMQRRPHQNVDRNQWIAFLRQSIDEDKPLDQLLREIVSSMWWNGSQRPQQRFFLDRAGDAHAIARDIGRIFFGRDMQCAQCHDHPQWDDYLQIDYHGLLAYVSPSSLLEGKYKDEKGAEQKQQLYVEKASNDAPFESVFEKGVLFRSGPRIIGGIEQFDPYRAPDQRYQLTPPAGAHEGVTPAPVISRRDALSSQLNASNRAFCENWANRLWALMMGRGLVHPLDMHHAENPPSNPELLQRLTQHFVDGGFRVSATLEQIALSQTYRRSVASPFGAIRGDDAILPPQSSETVAIACEVKSLSATLESNSKTILALVETAKQQMNDAETVWLEKQKIRVDIRAELEKSEVGFSEHKKKLDDANANLQKTTTAFENETKKAALLDEAAGKIELAKSLTTGDTNDLQQALATAKTRSENAKKELPNLEKSISEQTTARNTHSNNLETERVKLLEISNRLAQSETQLEASDRLYVDARRAWREATAKHTHLITQQKTLRDIESWIDSSKATVEATEQVTAQESQIAKLQRSLEDKTMVASSFQQSLAASRSQQDQLSKQRALQLQEQEFIQKQIAQLAETVSLLEKSATILENGLEIEAVKKSIAKGIQSRNVQMVNLQASIANCDAQLRTLSRDQAKLVEDIRSSEQDRLHSTNSLATHQSELQQLRNRLSESNERCNASLQSVSQACEVANWIGGQRALSPEQLGWSILQSTHVLQNYIAAELVEIEKKTPPSPGEDPTATQARMAKATRQAIDKLRPNVDVFANLFSSGVGQTADEFFATPDQALFMVNGGAVFSWCAPSGQNVGGRMLAQSDPTAACRLAYRALLSRDPEPKEIEIVTQCLDNSGDKKSTILQELVWAIVTGSEFRIYP
ncbi:MAG: DUF1549 domain-containing protein [Pirellula sp.]